MADIKAPRTRDQWRSQIGFLMAAIGSAIGLGNIWRFPGVAYENGGGAFMIPYVIALLCAGIPILFLDYALGHRYRGSAPAVFRRISRNLEWLGWWQVVICFFIMTYYAVIIAWALRYVIYSATIAWNSEEDGAGAFFYNDFIHVSDSPGYSLSPVMNVVVPLLFVWGAVLFIIAKGVSRGVEIANKICIPLLVVLFVSMVVRALTLPGAVDGLNALWTPNFDVLGNANVWIAAFAQIFYSLSVGFGIMLTYSSYLRRKSNLVGTGLVAAFANSSFEVLAGFGVFATLGFMALQQGVPVADLEGLSGISLSFITFPTVISQMPGGAIFGVLFFGSLTLAGITSLTSLVQVVAPAVGEKLSLSTRGSSLAVGIPAALVSILIFSTESGIFSLDVVDAFVNPIGVVSSAIFMCVFLAFGVRNLKVIQRHLNVVSGTGKLVGVWWRILVGLIVPVFLTYIFMDNLVGYIRNGYSADYTRGFEGIFGWGLIAVMIAVTAFFTLLKWRTPVDDFVPLDLDAASAPRRRRKQSVGGN